MACTKAGTRQVQFGTRVLRACPTCAALLERWTAANTLPAPDPRPRRPPRDTADQPPPPRTSELSAREREVLVLYASGSQAKQIARELRIGVSTVWQYLQRVRAKYASAGREAQTRVDLYERAFEDGFITPPASAGDGERRTATLFTDLVDALLAVPSVRHPESRKLMLELFPRREIADVVPYHAEDRIHVIALARTCVRFPGGLADLLDTVRTIDPESAEVERLGAAVSSWLADDQLGRRRIQVGVIEDHPLYRYALTRVLDEAPDIELGAVANTVQQFAIEGQLPGSVVVLDLTLRGIQGAAAVEHLALGGYKVLAMSEGTEQPVLLGVMQAGARGVLSKEVDSDELLRAIRAIADDNAYVSPTLAGAIIQDSEARHAGPKVVLSEREKQVLRLVAAGERDIDVAGTLNISVRTVRAYLDRIRDKTETHQRPSLTARPARNRRDR